MKLSEAPTFPSIRHGLKVKTPKGEGTINYGRLVQPSCNQWEAASVRFFDGGNTIFSAEEIEVLEEW